jgi:hypothetical protein
MKQENCHQNGSGPASERDLIAGYKQNMID